MKKIKFIIVCTMILFSVSAFAEWRGPEKVLEGLWGEADGQFGIFYGDNFDYFPKNFIVDKRNRILVLDVINRRLQIYGNDKIVAVLPKKLPPGYVLEEWPYDGSLAISGDKIIETFHGQIYSYNGNLLDEFYVGVKYFRGQDDNENLLFEDISTKKYYKYSPDGEFITSYNQEPLELGIKASRRQAGTDSKYDTTVQFEDITYHVTLDGDWDNFARDRNKYLYFTNSYTAKDPVSGEDSSTSLAVKYDRCGKKIGELELPISEYEPATQEELDRPTTKLRIRNEYGTPVIGPDGAVYAWKRTPTTYSILKWTWVDSPADFKGGPDAPLDLKIAHSSNDGLFLAWTASPQDPGCVEGYEVERSSAASGIFSNLATTSSGVVKYNDTSAFTGST